MRGCVIVVRRLTGADFLALGDEELAGVVLRGAAELDSVRGQVESILKEVRSEGDAALVKFTSRFDGVDLPAERLRVPPEAFKAAYSQLPAGVVEALRAAARNIETFHEAQLRQEWWVETSPGVRVGQVTRPIDSAGVYVPGGRASYPSSVLMMAVPARVAGVDRVVVATPPGPEGLPSPGILVAAKEAGVSEVYVVGGAQAVAALAFGTQTVKRVDKIFGPGNKYVNAAKQLVASWGVVAVDLPAGPSEVLILADEAADPRLVAVDLASQVEHDPDNVGVVVSTHGPLLDAVEVEFEKLLEVLDRADIVRRAWRDNVTLVRVASEEEAAAVVNRVAPEHLEILTRHPRETLKKIRHAGAVFMGPASPVPIGDYAAGSNHVLPTGGRAKVYSGLHVTDFLKTIDVVEATPRGLKALAPTVSTLAKYEGLDAHALAVDVREFDDQKP
ncbi:MAG: histidinol dehydrogenase [Promethearchaeota archaeon]